MSKKQKWMKREDIPERARLALDAFQAAFQYSDGKYKITHVRDDALFIQIGYGIDPYSVGRFILNNPTIYCEIEPVARQFLEFRMFFSDWMVNNECPRKKRWLDAPCENKPYQYAFVARIE